MSAIGLEVCLGMPSEIPATPPCVAPEPTGSAATSRALGDYEDSESSLEDAVNPLLESFIALLSQMQPTSFRILRGIRACRILQRGPGLWMYDELHTLHQQSEITGRLDEFWSHSWHAKPWTKYLSALLLNNGLPSFVLGTSSALLVCCLSVAGIFERGYCVPAGAVGYYATLLLWRRKKLVFLDVACICQTDATLKAEGLISMGAFLKSSKFLVVLWDTTYVSRLWCMFEMAAFLHSKGLDAEKRIVVCPVFLGPVILIGNLGFTALIMIFKFSQVPLMPWGWALLSALAFPCMTCLAHVVLTHCRSIEIMQRQVSQFTIEHSSCHCCDSDHIVDNTGERVLCDRKIILRCISEWFGSPSRFEQIVRTKLLSELVYQLANRAFSYWRIVQAACPVAWFVFDYFSGDMEAEHVITVALQASLYWLLFAPSGVLLLLRLAYALRHLGKGSFAQLLLSISLVAVGAAIFGAFFMLENSILPNLLGDRLPAVLILEGVMVVTTALLWLCFPPIETTSPAKWLE